MEDTEKTKAAIKEQELLAKKNRALLEKYPILKPYGYYEADEEYDYTWTELDRVPKGWHDMFLRLCDRIQEHLKAKGVPLTEFHFFDIKEKWGTLRIEVTGYSDDEIQEMLFDADAESMLYCPVCGGPSKCVTKGYVLYTCVNCAEKELKLTYDMLTKKDRPIWKEYNYETKQGTEKPTKYDAQFLSQWDAPVEDVAGEEGTAAPQVPGASE